LGVRETLGKNKLFERRLETTLGEMDAPGRANGSVKRGGTKGGSFMKEITSGRERVQVKKGNKLRGLDSHKSAKKRRG